MVEIFCFISVDSNTSDPLYPIYLFLIPFLNSFRTLHKTHKCYHIVYTVTPNVQFTPKFIHFLFLYHLILQSIINNIKGSSSRKRRRSKNNSNKNNKNTESKRSKSKSNEASSKNPTPTPSLTLTSVSSASIKSEIAKEQTPVKTKANRRHRPKRQTLNRNAQSQPINRTMRHPPTRKAQAPLTGRQQTQRNQQSNTINQAQISTSCSRYQVSNITNSNITIRYFCRFIIEHVNI